MNEWKDLDPYDLPSDILVPGAWEFQEDGMEDITIESVERVVHFVALLAEGVPYLNPYRIRRPEGYKSDGQSVGWKMKISNQMACQLRKLEGAVDELKRAMAKHDEPKAPTHEEIMTRWWDVGEWQRVVGFYTFKGKRFYRFVDAGVQPAEWFADKDSAEIPPA